MWLLILDLRNDDHWFPVQSCSLEQPLLPASCPLYLVPCVFLISFRSHTAEYLSWLHVLHCLCLVYFQVPTYSHLRWLQYSEQEGSRTGHCLMYAEQIPYGAA